MISFSFVKIYSQMILRDTERLRDLRNLFFNLHLNIYIMKNWLAYHIIRHLILYFQTLVTKVTVRAVSYTFFGCWMVWIFSRHLKIDLAIAIAIRLSECIWNSNVADSNPYCILMSNTLYFVFYNLMKVVLKITSFISIQLSCYKKRLSTQNSNENTFRYTVEPLTFQL